MMAQYNGVWFSIDFCCNNEEKDVLYPLHASEQLSRMSEALGVGGCCFTISRTRFSIVEWVIVVFFTKNLDQKEGTLSIVDFVVVEVSVPESGVTGWVLLAVLLVDEGSAEDSGVTESADFWCL